MFVRNQQGQWFEVEDKVLEKKQVSHEKIAELKAAELAAARQRAAEIIAEADDLTIEALREAIWGRLPDIPSAGFECWTADCWTADCWTAECLGAEMGRFGPYGSRFGPQGGMFGTPQGPTYGMPMRSMRRR